MMLRLLIEECGVTLGRSRSLSLQSSNTYFQCRKWNDYFKYNSYYIISQLAPNLPIINASSDSEQLPNSPESSMAQYCIWSLCEFSISFSSPSPLSWSLAGFHVPISKAWVYCPICLEYFSTDMYLPLISLANILYCQ